MQNACQTSAAGKTSSFTDRISHFARIGLSRRVAALLLGTVFLTGCTRQKEVNMFEGATANDALTELSKKIGHPVRALKVQITPLAFSVQVQDPAQPRHVDEYRLEHIYGMNDRLHHVSVTGPTAVQLNLINENLEENLFDLADVNIAGLASAAQEAVGRASLEDTGAVKEINIQRHLFLIPSARSGDVEWDISVKSDREYANAYADAKGHLTRMNLDGTTRAKNLNLFTDMKELKNVTDMMRSAFGSSRAIKLLHFEKNYLWFDGRIPQNPKKLAGFTVNLNGVLNRGDATPGITGAPPADAMFFAVDDVDWSQVPAILKEAQAKLEIPGGSIYKVSVGTSTFDGDVQPVRWTVEVRDGNGENGEVDFDAKGAASSVRLPKDRRPPVNMFAQDGAKQAIADIRKKFGPHAKLMELRFDDKRAILITRNPKETERLRDYIYDQDHFADFPGSDHTPFYRGFGDDWLFDLDEAEPAFLPKMDALEKQTLERLKLSNGKIERITISRQKNMQLGNQKVLIEIRATGDHDKSGWVNYDLQGNVASVMMP